MSGGRNHYHLLECSFSFFYLLFCWTDIQIWPQGEYPLIPVGKLVLNRNPENYFAEVEQIAFSPAHMPPGIEASPDKMLQVSIPPSLVMVLTTVSEELYRAVGMIAGETVLLLRHTPTQTGSQLPSDTCQQTAELSCQELPERWLHVRGW